MVEFLKLEFEEREFDDINNKIEVRKNFNNILKNVREKTRIKNCMYCGEEISSCCNSHSIPAFCLRNISHDGNVLNFNLLIQNPILDNNNGIKNTGVFHLICRECDSKIFKESEEPSNYETNITSKMIAQIAMKNYLKSIYKRVIENMMYEEIKSYCSNEDIINTEFLQTIGEKDLNEYKKNFKRAKKINEKNYEGEYHLVYYEKLNYVVPIAFQSNVALAVGLDGEKINEPYSSINKNIKYQVQDIHICIFPLKDSTIIIMFVDSKFKRYRNFYKKFRKLPTEKKLSIINYIIFLYSEDMFISKDIENEIFEYDVLKNIAKQTTIGRVNNFYENIDEQFKETFDLNKSDSIPNLLDKKYKLR